jgi:RND family efflux transporter MFP subunit
VRRLLLPILALAACRAEPGGDAEEGEPPVAHVRCVPVATRSIADVAVLRGTIATPPLAEAVVASPVPGRIAKLLVEEGDLVVANQLIAQIDDPTLGASAAESGAEVEAAMVEQRSATTERVRTERLLREGIVAQKELDDALAREGAARASVHAAGARSRLARRQVARTDLRAPRAGTVLHVFKDTGAVLEAADTAVAEIADLSVLELHAQVTGGELVRVSVGAAASVELDAMPGRAIVGEVVAVSPAVDPVTSLGTVRVRLTLPDGQRPAIGLAGAATVRGAPRTALVIPRAAIRRSIQGADEALVCADGHAAARQVELGTREEAHGVIPRDVAARSGGDRPGGAVVEVRTGLAASDAVVVDHVLGLEDGTPIEATIEAATP